MRATERIRELTGAAPPRADGLIGIKGVLEVVEKQESPRRPSCAIGAMLESLEQALRALVRARAAEGARLKPVLDAQLDEIERLVAIVEASPARTPAAIAERLQASRSAACSMAATASIRAPAPGGRADRHAGRRRGGIEAAAARTSAPRASCSSEEGAVGRKLDFLAQEFNREANTLCSKANDVEITRAGLALKTVIDQMREQVQNIE